MLGVVRLKRLRSTTALITSEATTPFNWTKVWLPGICTCLTCAVPGRCRGRSTEAWKRCGGTRYQRMGGRKIGRGGYSCSSHALRKDNVDHELGCIVDALPGLVWTALPNGEADYLNQRWCEYTGFSLDQALGIGWHAALHPDDKPMLLSRWAEIAASGEQGAFEARLRRRDGAHRWFEFRASPLRNANGRLVKWCGVNTDIDEQRQAANSLRSLENRYRLIVDGLPAIVTLLKSDGHVEHANRHMLDYLGTKLEDMKGREVGQAFHPEDRPEVLVRWNHSATTGEPYDCEARLRRFDGVYRWFHTRGLPLRDEGDSIFLWYFLQVDIDDRKQAERLLAGERSLLERLARGDERQDVLNALCHIVEEGAPGCLCSVVLADSTGAIVEHGAAPSLPETFINSIIGRAINLEAGPCGMATFLNQQVLSKDLTSETRWQTWCPIALAHGLQSCWSTPITSISGKALGAFAVYFKSPTTPTSLLEQIIDQFTHIASIAVTRVQSDAALRQSEAFLAEGQRLSATGTYYWRVIADEIEGSDQLYRMFELDPLRLQTFQSLAERVHPDDTANIRQITDLARQGERHFESDFRVILPDGSVSFMHMVARRLSKEHEDAEYVGALQDVTQHKRAQEALGAARSELAKVERAMSLGVLTASIAHEVNQPLAGIITNANTCLRMLAAAPPNLEGARETAWRTIRDGHRASDVVARLRALFAKSDVSNDSVDLNQVVRDVIALSAPQLHKVNVRTELMDGLPRVAGDRVQLQQVLFNLIVNAAEAMRGTECAVNEVLIRTQRGEDATATVTVTDAGRGFDPGSIERIFAPFHSTKPGGMGIGLAISRSIIESHQGTLWAAPNAGAGATFGFAIPTQV